MANRVRSACQDCGGPKGPGRGERYCETCKAKLHAPSLSLDDQLAMVRAYNRPRATLDSVAQQFYCARATVQRVLKIHGVASRPPNHYGTPRISVDEELLRTQLYGQGYSLADVAAIVGRSPSSVHQTLRKAGVKMHPRGVNLRAREHVVTGRLADGRFAPRETTRI